LDASRRAITAGGGRFFSRVEEYVVTACTKHIILVLCNEFEDDLIVVFEGTPYFQALAITDLAASDDLDLSRYRRILRS
jgi:hypothetical protein